MKWQITLFLSEHRQKPNIVMSPLEHLIQVVSSSWSINLGPCRNPYGDDGSKAEQASLAVNRVLEELVLACRPRGDEIRDRCHVTVIGYGENVNCIVDDMISEVPSALVEVKKVKKLIPDGAGGVIETEIEMPIWLEPKASSQTPMHEAFQRAAEVIERWISDKPDGYPPIVINITDGAATRPDLTADAARKIMNLHTTDGASLVFNLHIANSGKMDTFPHNTTQFSGEPLAEFLFDMSSAFPQPLMEDAERQGFSIELGARCFGYNMDEPSMIKILQFGSLNITQIRSLPPSTD